MSRLTLWQEVSLLKTRSNSGEQYFEDSIRKTFIDNFINNQGWLGSKTWQLYLIDLLEVSAMQLYWREVSSVYLQLI